MKVEPNESIENKIDEIVRCSETVDEAGWKKKAFENVVG